MKDRIKQNNIFLLLILFLFINCKDTSNVDSFAIVDFYKVHQNDLYNVNVYILNNYDESKNLKSNLSSQDSLISLNLIIDKSVYEKIRNKSSKSNFLLSKVKFRLNKKLVKYKTTVIPININEKWIKCRYYSILDDYDLKSLNIIYYDQNFPLKFDKS